MNIISLKDYKEIKSGTKKDKLWLYTISYDELFNEFINTFDRFELDPQSGEIHEWLDLVSDALNDRFYNKKSY